MIKPENLRIVLVEPEQARNIGAVVRVAANFRLPGITVVQGQELTDEDLKDVRIASSGAVDLVDVRVVSSISQAIEGSDSVLGTSGRKRDSQIPTYASIAESPALSHGSSGALVTVLFGRESSGLTTGEVDLCHALVRLPVNEDFPSMNLSHAIAIVVYQALFCTESLEPQVDHSTETLAPTDLQERWLSDARALRLLDQARMRRLLHRSRPTPEDMAMLFNLLKACRNPQSIE